MLQEPDYGQAVIGCGYHDDRVVCVRELPQAHSHIERPAFIAAKKHLGGSNFR